MSARHRRRRRERRNLRIVCIIRKDNNQPS